MGNIDLIKDSNLLYTIKEEEHGKKELLDILSNHDEIKFVSLMGVDLYGNSTDAKIPISLFKEDINGFLKDGVQTDGSSVELENIATLNDGKIILVPDVECTWVVDYNFSVCDGEKIKPIGTIIIPSFLKHSEEFVCSRSVLKRATKHIKSQIKEIVNDNQKLKKEIGIIDNKVEEVVITSAAELEFWVKTPQELSDEEELSTSQGLKEQYWKRTEGDVRTCLEYILILMEKYDFEPEMGHKEVGGVRSKLRENGDHFHIMEQLEVDWKYSDPITTSDRLIFIKHMITDIFAYYGLEVSFDAKPVEGVAGNGQHIHVGIGAVLDNGNFINLYNQKDFENNYLSAIGYAAIAGILKNYDYINPFITMTSDAFNRLKPGFEAPVCVVCSLGKTPLIPSRNRSVLLCLIRNLDSKNQTRFELRSPNPKTNTYLAFSAVFQSMLDGMLFYKDIETNDILKDISKKKGEKSDYFEIDREYLSEENVFEKYDQDERDILFSIPPATVYENNSRLKNNLNGIKLLTNGDVFTEKIIDSYLASSLDVWSLELKSRTIEKNRNIIRRMKKLHGEEDVSDFDIVMWSKIKALKWELMKDTTEKKSLFSKISDAITNNEFSVASNLQKEMMDKMEILRKMYNDYKRNLI